MRELEFDRRVFGHQGDRGSSNHRGATHSFEKSIGAIVLWLECTRNESYQSEGSTKGSKSISFGGNQAVVFDSRRLRL